MTTKELIRAEIRKWQSNIEAKCPESTSSRNYTKEEWNAIYEYNAYTRLLSFLDTLPDEPVTDCHDLEEEMEKFIETFGWGKTKHLAEKELISATARHFAQWGANHLRDTTKKVSEDLEEAAIDFADYARKALYSKDYAISSIADYDHGCIDAFKAGAEWQYQKDRGKFAKIKAKTWCEGFDACKEQMMKGAVEGYVNYYEDSGGILMAEAQVGCPYHNGDKVRIIIVKEGEE